MYIKVKGRHAEIYENGRLLKHDDAIKAVEQALKESDDPAGIDILSDTLIMLESERCNYS